MWTRNALAEALGKPDEEAYQPDPTAPGTNLSVMRWRCDRDGLVSAVGRRNDGFDLEVSCAHRRHLDLQKLTQAKVRNVQLFDSATRKNLSALPGGLHGSTLAFDVEIPVAATVRVEAQLDAEYRLGVIEEFNAGNVGPGLQRIEVPLAIDPNGPGAKDGPAKHTVDITIEILDPVTAERDWGADGIVLYRHTIPVA